MSSSGHLVLTLQHQEQEQQCTKQNHALQLMQLIAVYKTKACTAAHAAYCSVQNKSLHSSLCSLLQCAKQKPAQQLVQLIAAQHSVLCCAHTASFKNGSINNDRI
jgi:Ni,Fe-hydrogenase maturation factor